MIKTRSLYPLIRGKLAEHGIDQTYLAELMEKSLTYVSRRMTGKAHWSQEDQYFLMDLLKIPYERMHEAFPKDGRLKKGA